MELSDFNFSKLLNKRLAIHVLFWVAVFLYNLVGNWNYSENKRAMVELYASQLLVQMAMAYFLSYFQLPRYLIQKRYVPFFTSLFASVYITFVSYVTFRILYFEPTYPSYFGARAALSHLSYFDVARFVMYATSFSTPALIMAGIKLIKNQHKEQQQRQLLEKEKLQTELSFLKNQLNPHFLFNTLNNLYMLTLKSSPQAPVVVAKLSDTLDYILYRCQERTVPLKGEIELIQSYLALEKIRHSGDVFIDFDLEGEPDSESIAPLIMLSLVENAFKHGINKHPGPSKLNIKLAVKKNEISFSVFNSKWFDQNKSANSNHIGLKNIKRQLELIYPNKHSVDINEQENSYFVQLRIETR